MFGNYLKMAWRVLGRRKFFTFVSLFGIGFTMTALLIAVALVDHLLAPSYPETRLDRTLVLERMRMSGESSTWISGPGYKFTDTYARDLPGVERMSISTRPGEASAFLEGRKLVFQMRHVDAEYWKVLEFAFVEGAPFSSDDDTNGNRVAVIGESARMRFFGESSAAGRSIELDGREYRVVGVVRDAPEHRRTAAADVWVPLGSHPARGFFDRMLGGCQVSFLLEPDAEKDQVKAAFRERLTRVEFDDPERYNEMAGMPMTRLESFSMGTEIGEAAPRTTLLLWALGALAFMALPAINLININLSRIYERASEIGVRKAFGAASRNLVWQFVVENIVLSVIGGVIGLLGAFAVMQLVALFPQVPVLDIRLNWRIFTATLVLAVVFGLLSGVWPAWKMSRQHPVLALRGGGS
jgi:putative ABC transport system permease protein